MLPPNGHQPLAAATTTTEQPPPSPAARKKTREAPAQSGGLVVLLAMGRGPACRKPVGSKSRRRGDVPIISDVTVGAGRRRLVGRGDGKLGEGVVGVSV